MIVAAGTSQCCFSAAQVTFYFWKFFCPGANRFSGLFCLPSTLVHPANTCTLALPMNQTRLQIRHTYHQDVAYDTGHVNAVNYSILPCLFVTGLHTITASCIIDASPSACSHTCSLSNLRFLDCDMSGSANSSSVIVRLRSLLDKRPVKCTSIQNKLAHTPADSDTSQQSRGN